MSDLRIGVKPPQIGIPDQKGLAKPQEVSENSFGEVLKGFVQDVNQLQQNSSTMSEKFALGQVENVHQVMIAAEEAGVAFQLLLEIRNKLLDAYQELIRMPV
jgi:flagellar hook-basal body complex protein FliE